MKHAYVSFAWCFFSFSFVSRNWIERVNFIYVNFGNSPQHAYFNFVDLYRLRSDTIAYDEIQQIATPKIKLLISCESGAPVFCSYVVHN